MRFQVNAVGIQVEFDTLEEAKRFGHTLPKGAEFSIIDQQAMVTNPVIYIYGVSGAPEYVTRSQSPFTRKSTSVPKSKPR
jgi:hypothetical protein